MIKVKGFKGVVYNKDKIKDFDLVTAPPYDVISPKERDCLYKKSNYNVVRLILGKMYKSDNKKSNRYSRAAAFIEKWMAKKVLVRDPDLTLYVYLQEFTDPQTKKKVKRLGFIGHFVLQEFKNKNIYPHEWTLSKPKADRFELIKATSSNYSPVFSLFSDKNKKVDSILKKSLKSKADIRVKDSDNTVHEIYRITDKKMIDSIQKALNNKKLFIADGHHRYETALNYKKHIKKIGKKSQGVSAEATLMYFTNLNGSGLKIYPIHRSVRNLSRETLKNLISNLGKYFTITPINSKKTMLKEVLSAKTGNYIFGMYFANKFYTLKLKSKKTIAQAAGKKQATNVDKLNVSLLHNLIIDKILKADFEDDVYYLKNPDTVIKDVNLKKNRAGFFLAAITADEIVKAALNSERLPRKSTYFYPKLYSGLVINKMNRP
jgi:uncharacterized protein (DUF1015 family)